MRSIKNFITKSFIMMFMIIGMFTVVATTRAVTAADVSFSYKVTSKTAVTGTNVPDGVSATYSQTYASTAGQATANNSMTITVSGFEGTLNSITLSMKSNSSKGAGGITLKVGSKSDTLVAASTKFNDDSFYGNWSTSYVDLTFATTNCKTVSAGEDIVITIAATTNSLYCQSFTFNCSVADSEMTDQEIADNVLNSLEVPAEATTDFILEDVEGLVWTSNNSAISVNGVNATVTRPEGGEEDATVTLLATYTLNGVDYTKEFTVSVPAKAASSGTAVLEYTNSSLTTNMTEGSNNASLVNVDASLFTVTSIKNSASNHVGLNKAGQIRLYANTNGGTALSVECIYNIKKIEIAYGTTVSPVKVNDVESTPVANETIEYTINSNTFTVQNIGTTQVFIMSITIYYGESSSTPDPEPQEYTVTFNTDGGSSIDSVVVIAGNQVSKPNPDPTKDGYTFIEWQLDGVAYDFSSAVNDNITLVAVWQFNNTETIYYEKVTATPASWEGTYLIVYETGNLAFNGGLEVLDAALNTISVTITNSKIESNATTNAASFTITVVSGGYTIKSASNYYIGQTSDTNGLKSSESEAYVNTISLNGTNIDIVSGGAYLRYNKTSGQERFRYYKSGSYTNQQAIQLYKLDDGTDSTVYNVSYDANGGIASKTSDSFATGAYAGVELATATRLGYTFLGWYEGETKVESLTEDKNYNLQAKWQRNVLVGYQAQSNFGNHYAQVLDVANLQDGDVILIVGTQVISETEIEYYSFVTNATGNNVHGEPIGMTDNKIYQIKDNVQTLVVIDNGDGTYSFRTSDNKYLYVPTNQQNQLKFDEDAEKATHWTITISEGKATIHATVTVTIDEVETQVDKYLLFNKGSDLFACYGGITDQSIETSIYKYTEVEETITTANVRFVGAFGGDITEFINESTHGEVGFIITEFNGNPVDSNSFDPIVCSTIYTGLSANKYGYQITVTAESVNCNFMFGFEITDIPVGTTISFKSYVKTINGDIFESGVLTFVVTETGVRPVEA